MTHRSAGHEHAVLRGRPPRAVDVTAPTRRRPRDGIRVHIARLHPRDVTTRRGLRFTTVSRTLLDLAADLRGARAAGGGRRGPRTAQAASAVHRGDDRARPRTPRHRRAAPSGRPPRPRSRHPDRRLRAARDRLPARPRLPAVRAQLHREGRRRAVHARRRVDRTARRRSSSTAARITTTTRRSRPTAAAAGGSAPSAGTSCAGRGSTSTSGRRSSRPTSGPCCCARPVA